MKRLIECELALVLAMLMAGLWQARHLPRHVDGVVTRFEATETKINASAQHLDDATRTWADASREQAASITSLVTEAHGTLRTANAQLEHVAPLLDQARTTIAGAGEDVHALVQSGQDVAAAATQSIAAVQPVVQHVDAEVTTLSPDLNRMIHASADGMEHVSGIADNGQKITTHLEHDFDAPKPWWKKALPVITDSAKLAECFTRGNCF